MGRKLHRATQRHRAIQYARQRAPETLTTREGQTLSLAGHGLTNREIALAMEISEATAKVYMWRLQHKTGARDRFELTLFALDEAHRAAMPALPDMCAATGI
jgi:DNA-binding NarL/FixJ family response regulator